MPFHWLVEAVFFFREFVPKKTSMLPTTQTAVPRANASKAQPQQAKAERAPNFYRAQMALNSVMQNDKSGAKDYTMEATSAELVVDYGQELSVSILEDAALIAKHRNAAEIEACDINLILTKKYNINIPLAVSNVPRLILHKEKLGTGSDSMRNGGYMNTSSFYSSQIKNVHDQYCIVGPGRAPKPEPRGGVDANAPTGRGAKRKSTGGVSEATAAAAAADFSSSLESEVGTGTKRRRR
jgi:hypothetical protein